MVAIGWWSARQLRAGRTARDVELTLLTVVVGAIALFLAISVLPGQVTFFQGFDDAVEMAGASLVARGYFPWRDMLFVHGLFPDVLTGSLGRAIFGDSIWGVFAGHTVILIPLFWVSTYLFAVWVSRRNPWFLALVFLGVAVGLRSLLEVERSLGEAATQLEWSERFIGLPVALIVLRRDTAPAQRRLGGGVDAAAVRGGDPRPGDASSSPGPRWPVWSRPTSSTADRSEASGPICGSPAGASAPGSSRRPRGPRSWRPSARWVRSSTTTS